MNFDIIWRDKYYIKSYFKIENARFIIREYFSKCIILSVYLTIEKDFIYNYPVYGNYNENYYIKDDQLIFEVYDGDILVFKNYFKNAMKKLPLEYIPARDIIKNNFYLFKKDGGLSDSIRNNIIWEKYFYEILNGLSIDFKNTNIIDIGANLGAHTLNFAEMVDELGKVYAFEPQRIVYYQLCANIISNGFDNVYAFNVALSDNNGIANIEKVDYYSDNTINIGNTHIVKNNGDEVEERTLDSYNFNNISLIKIDVQGYENFILNGSIETIKKNRPVIFIEIEDEQLKIYDKSRIDIFNFFEKQQYILRHIYLYDYIAIPLEKNSESIDVYIDGENKIILNSRICFNEVDIFIKNNNNNNIIYHNKFNEINDNNIYWFIPDNKDYLDGFLFEIFKKDILIFNKKIIKS